METIKATAESVVYRNEENDYTVLIAKSGRSRLTAIGTIPEVAEGEQLELEGNWQEHPVYGRQFRVASVTPSAPLIIRATSSRLPAGSSSVTVVCVRSPFTCFCTRYS